MGLGKYVIYWSKAPINEFLLQNAILALIIFVWLNVGNINSFCEPYVGIAFKEEKPSVCFVNFMWVLQFEYFQSI
jgi:hypothetical protein